MGTSENIKMLRLKCGMSQDELAKKTGYTDRSSIAKIEAGKVDLTETKISMFAKALNVSPAQLMGIDGLPAGSDILPDHDATIEDFPEARLIARAGKKMTPERKADMMRMLKMMFPEEFSDD